MEVSSDQWHAALYILIRGLLRDVVYLCWPIEPRIPNAGGGGVAWSKTMSTAVHITWPGAQINFGDPPPYLTYASNTQGSMLQHREGRSKVNLRSKDLDLPVSGCHQHPGEECRSILQCSGCSRSSCSYTVLSKCRTIYAKVTNFLRKKDQIAYCFQCLVDAFHERYN